MDKLRRFVEPLLSTGIFSKDKKIIKLSTGCDDKYKFYLWPLQLVEEKGSLVSNPIQRIFLFKKEAKDLVIENSSRPVVADSTPESHKIRLDQLGWMNNTMEINKTILDTCEALLYTDFSK